MKKIREIMENALLNDNVVICDYDKIQKILGRYFQDKQFLKKFRSTGDAISLSTHILLLRKYKEANHIFNILLKTFNSIILNQEAITLINQEYTKIIESQNFMWSKERLSETLDRNDVYKAVDQIFDAINTICEGSIKLYINILYYIEKKNGSIPGNQKTFGDKVSVLLIKYPFLKIRNINISQWRNISDHRDFKIIGSKIKCKFSNQSIVISKKELIKVLNKITLLYNAFYLAFTLFFYNNMNVFSISGDTFRDEIWLDNLKVSFSSKNFLIKNASNERVFIVTIMDCIENNSKKDTQNRLIEISQYMINFWPFVRKSMRLVYTDNKNNILAKIFYNNKDIVYMTNHELDLSYLAEKMKFEFISKDFLD